MEPPAAESGLPGSNLPVQSVSELSASVKRTVEDAFGYVRVRGEISRPSFPGSGHVYLTLKDDKAVLSAVAWRGTAGKLSVRPEEGLEVICTGRLTTYQGQSRYQLVIETMELAGEGALLKLLEERRKKLAGEGLFAEDRKRPLPFLPTVIGVVTSPTGAVIRDILHRLEDRFPRHVLLWPVRVQGDGAAAEIAAAIVGFNTLAPDGPVPRPDVLIVGRGGGSLEDLWAFNEEIVVRAAADSEIPLISAVGHETDTTLIDFASDRRAPTPTAAAEMAVPVRAELWAQVQDDGQRLDAAAGRLLTDRRTRLEGLARGVIDPARLWEEMTQRLDGWSERLGNALPATLDRSRQRLDGLAGRLRHPRDRLEAFEAGFRGWTERLDNAYARHLDRAAERVAALGKLLESYSYENVLGRGYAVVRDAEDRPLMEARAISPGMALSLEFAGRERVGARAEDSAARAQDSAAPAEDSAAPAEQGVSPKSPPKPRAKPGVKTRPPGQGSLF